jgi:hypothetical protein
MAIIAACCSAWTYFTDSLPTWFKPLLSPCCWTAFIRISIELNILISLKILLFKTATRLNNQIIKNTINSYAVCLHARPINHQVTKLFKIFLNLTLTPSYVFHRAVPRTLYQNHVYYNRVDCELLGFLRIGMSFMKMLNNRGLRTEPWGTPASISLSSDTSPLTLTQNFLFARKFWIQLIR